MPLPRLSTVPAEPPHTEGRPRSGMTSAALAVLVLSLPGLTAQAADPAEDVLPLPGRAGDFTLSVPDIAEDAASGWYARLDAGIARMRVGDATWSSPASGLFAFPGDSGDAWTAGFGIGYQVTPWLRTDVTVDYLSPTGSARLAATSALASLYWDILTWNGLTPYLGGGVG
ncbi:MAG: hypothetical protein B7Z15_09745, partial [Rhizobiales bacterium 32-66-8]